MSGNLFTFKVLCRKEKEIKATTGFQNENH